MVQQAADSWRVPGHREAGNGIPSNRRVTGSPFLARLNLSKLKNTSRISIELTRSRRIDLN